MGNLMLLGHTPWPEPTPEEYQEMAVGVQYHRTEAARIWDSKRPLEIIQQLAKDPDEVVRMAVAVNGLVPASVLTDLSTDPNEGIRMDVARHRNTPQFVREKLAHDESELVRIIVAGEEV